MLQPKLALAHPSKYKIQMSSQGPNATDRTGQKRRGVMKQIGRMILGAALAVALYVASGGEGAVAAEGQTLPRANSTIHTASHLRATDVSAQRRKHRRPPTRIRVHPRYQPDDVYPRYNPGPNAVRDCTATYVQEFRPSGTVIVPRMHCFWRRG